MLRTVAARGAAAGMLGVVAMTVSEKLEQRITGRPDSFVPSRTLAHVLGLSRPDEDRWGRNMLMHYGNGLVLGPVRGVMAAANLRGPWAALMFTPLRLTWDQTLENYTGVGAPPWTWPRDELVIDVLHKGVFALATGAVADALIEPARASSATRKMATPRWRGLRR
ncbi:MAG: hypothetical protein M3P40_09060 [Actinomycetota bacterium]|nr:hypothetical protein [Actinomycetota bacterium]